MNPGTHTSLPRSWLELIRGDLNLHGMVGMKNCGLVATALALIMLVQAAGPTSTAPTASAGQRGKSKSRPAPGKGGILAQGPVCTQCGAGAAPGNPSVFLDGSR